MMETCRARLTPDDRLTDADEALIQLNGTAGGRERLVLPAVLTLARLARRLGVPISRPVRIADDEQDWEVWLRAVPEGADVRLTLADWTRRPHATRRASITAPPAAANALLPENFSEPLHKALDRPLSRIVATAESLRAVEDEAVPETYRGYARDIAEAGRHLQSLLGDLVELDQVERAAPIEREAFDLALVARRAVGLLGMRAAERNIEVRVEGERTFGIGDERRTLQIAMNLVANALLHSPAEKAVAVRIGLSNDEAALTVSDTGPGIPHADQDRVFEKFVRLSPNETAGSGLGLYISRRLARAMGGDLTLESEAGWGARFTLSLPAA